MRNKRFNTETQRHRVENFFFSLTLCLCISFYIASSDTHAQVSSEKVQKGISLLNQGNLDGAAAVLEEVIRSEPNHGPARFMLGQIAIERHQWARAEEHLKIAVGSNVKRLQLAWQLLGKVQLLQHRYGDAGQSFSEALKHGRDSAPAFVGRAQTNLFLNDYSAALADLGKATSPEAILLRAQTLIYLDKDQDAKQVLQNHPLAEGSHQKTARHLLLAIEKKEAADHELRLNISENLGDAQAYLSLAILEQRNGRMNPALFETAFQLDDQSAIALLFLKKHAPEYRMAALPKRPLPEVIRNVAVAQTALKQGQFSQAREVVNRILIERPFHIAAEVISIEADEKENNNWEALEGYEKILNRVSGIPSVESRAATLSEKMGAYELAECHIERALRIQPQDGYLHHVLAGILHARKKTTEALKEAKQAIDLGHRAAAAYVSLGNLYYENMEIPKSIEALKTAVEIDPHAAETMASFALSALTAEEHEELRKILESHIQVNPNNINTLYSLALMHMNENRLEKAKEYLLHLEKLTPGHSQVHYNLALLYFRLGENDQGQKAMARFEELKEENLKDFAKHTEASKIRLNAEDAFHKKKFEESIRLYSRLVMENRAEPEDLVNLGKSYAIIRKEAEALEAFEKALGVAPVSIDALAGASEMAKILKKTELANLYGRRLHLLSKSCDSRQ